MMERGLVLSNKKKIIFALICYLGIFTPILANANEEDIGFIVEPIHNNNQIDPEVSYFYVKTVPGEQQEIKVKIKSTRKEEVKVKIHVANAITSEKGTIDYSADTQTFNDTLEAPLSAIVSTDSPDVTIGNYEEKEVVFKVTPPKEDYPGAKMGTLVFETTEESDNESKSGVDNKFSYRIGLVASESPDSYMDGKTLNLLDAKASIKRGKKMILATLQNPEPKVLANLALTVELRKKNDEQIIKKREVSNYTLAPNSNFDFEIDYGSTAVSPGDYVLSVKGTNGLNSWNLTKEFNISGSQAKKINDDYALKIVTPTWIKIYTLLSFLITVILAFVLRKRRVYMEKQWKEKRKKIRKKKEQRRERNET